MSSISQLIPSKYDLAGFAPGNKEFRSSQSMKISTVNHESTDIVLFTQEGDKITLSSDSSYSADYVNYRGLLLNSNGSVQIEEKSLSLSNDSRFSMTIEGDLSDEELKDINKAIKIIDKIVQKLKSGDIEKAMMLADRAIDLESISGMNASVEQEQKVIMETRIQTSISGQGSNPDGGNSEDGATGKIDFIANKISDIIKSTFKNDNTLKVLDNYFSQFIKKEPDKKAERDQPSQSSDGLEASGNHLKDTLKDIYTGALTD